MKKLIMKFVKLAFQTPYKKALKALVIYAMKNNFRQIPLLIVTGIYNSLSPKTKISFVRVSEDFSHLSVGPSFFMQNVLHAAKPQFFYQDLPLLEIKKQSLSILTLKDAKIIGSSNMVIVNAKEALYEPFYHDERDRWDYTDACIMHNFGQSFAIRYKISKTHIPCGIMISGNYSFNYYHFIFELLSKYMLLDKLDLPSNIPLIIDMVVLKTPQFKELLGYFNTCGRDIIPIDNAECRPVGTLYYIPFLNIIAPNFKDVNDIRFQDCLFNLVSINYLRDKLLPKMHTINSKKKIFLSRRNASAKRRCNENELETVFEKYDFQIVYPENLSIAKQMSLFNNAEVIAGVTGAAFTNILFCNPDCKILCITPVQNELSIFSTIAKHLKLDLQYISAHEINHIAQDLHDKFTINSTHVENVLIDFLRR